MGWTARDGVGLSTTHLLRSLCSALRLRIHLSSSASCASSSDNPSPSDDDETGDLAALSLTSSTLSSAGRRTEVWTAAPLVGSEEKPRHGRCEGSKLVIAVLLASLCSGFDVLGWCATRRLSHETSLTSFRLPTPSQPALEEIPANGRVAHDHLTAMYGMALHYNEVSSIRTESTREPCMRFIVEGLFFPLVHGPRLGHGCTTDFLLVATGWMNG